jgi:hypothetical protein
VVFDWSAVAEPRTLMPELTGDMLIVRHIGGPSDIRYSLYARDGTLASRFKIEIPGAQETISHTIAPLADGTGYVAVAVAVNGVERAAALCLLDSRGRLNKVVRTDPFWPYFVAVASDGTIWAFGTTGPEDIPNSDAPTLYHFSKAGELLSRMLPRRLFGEKPPFELSDELGVPALRAAGDHVVLYSPHTCQLIELSLDGTVVSSKVIKLPNQQRAGVAQSRSMSVAGLVLTRRGVIYARLAGGDGTGLYELDGANQRWVALPEELMAKVRGYSLIGSTGDDVALIPTGPRNFSVAVEWLHLTPRFAP